MTALRGLNPNLIKAQAARACKIVATLGPSSANKVVLTDMVKEGLDIVRLNFSHGSYDEHFANIALVRAVEREMERPIAILQDLCGPKIRTTALKQKGSYLTLFRSIPHQKLFRSTRRPSAGQCCATRLVQHRIVRQRCDRHDI